jgi:hypothetical protein
VTPAEKTAEVLLVLACIPTAAEELQNEERGYAEHGEDGD